MKQTLNTLFAAAAAVAAFTLAPHCAGAGPPAFIRIDLAHRAVTVSPHLFGVFFEEINHAGDGGLYAEMVRNREFDARTPLTAWQPYPSGQPPLHVGHARPLSPAHANWLRLSAPAGMAQWCGARNLGYWGMSVQAGVGCRLTLYARSHSAVRGTIQAQILATSLKPDSQPVRARLGANWRKITIRLKPGVTDPHASLLLTVPPGAAADVAFASLFPVDTYDQHPNGLRRDLAMKLASVHPAFIRFPGGCYVEGDKLQDAFQWQKSLGNPALRPGHWDLWGYHSTDGLGFFEYLQMCEDLHAAPLFGFNCGMSHTANVPLDQLQPWIRSALNAIEFANGAVSTKFGAIRAKYGHPRPFNLRLVEVGNEESGQAYNARYALFYDALKKKYPYLKLIATWPVTSRPMDYLDEHYYSSPQWFFQNASRYDSYRRSGPRIFVGEYAVTQDCGKGNLRAAVAEAAFMTGLERNSDIVRMASYAPLFVNVHDRFWNPDAIEFNDAHSWGTPSYYVQQMFGRNRPTVMLPLTLKQAARSAAVETGAIGLGTWNTQAVYRNVKVTGADGAALYKAPLSAGTDGFVPQSGTWSTGDGGLEQTAAGDNHFCTAGDAAWSNYTLTLEAKKLTGAEGFLVMFHVKDARNFTWWNIGGWGNTQDGIEKSVDGGKALLGGYVPDRVESGKWYRIRVQVTGSAIRCWLNGKLIESVTDVPPPSLFASAGIDSKHHQLVITVVNGASSATEANMSIPALGRRTLTAEQQVLTGSSPDAENSAAEPDSIAPKQLAALRIGAAFRHTFPAWSVTILRASLGRLIVHTR